MCCGRGIGGRKVAMDDVAVDEMIILCSSLRKVE